MRKLVYMMMAMLFLGIIALPDQTAATTTNQELSFTTNAQTTDSTAVVISTKEQLKARFIQAINNHEREVPITISASSAYSNNVQAIFNDIRLFTEEYTYAKGVLARYGYQSLGNNVTIKLEYRNTAEQQTYVNTEIQRILKEIIKPNMSEVEKVAAVNEYIVKNTRYEENVPSELNSSPYASYALFKGGVGVCQAYAVAAYEMLKALGFEVEYVTGYANGISHAWNLVKVDGQWYNLDTTWNDPSFGASIQNVDDFISYKYFLISDQVIKADHVFDEYASRPKATSERFSAVRQIPSSMLNYNGTLFSPNGVMQDGVIYFPDYGGGTLQIYKVNLKLATPIVELFSSEKALDLTVANNHVYYVNFSFGLELKKINIDTKQVSQLANGPIHLLRTQYNEVVAYSYGTKVFAEPIVASIPAHVQAVITQINQLNSSSATFMEDVAKASASYHALTASEKTAITNYAALVAAQGLVKTYEASIATIIAAINQLSKDYPIGYVKTETDAVTVLYNAAPLAVKAKITNSSLLQSYQQYVANNIQSEAQLAAQVPEVKAVVDQVVYLSADFKEDAEKAIDVVGQLGTNASKYFSANYLAKVNEIKGKYVKMKTLSFGEKPEYAPKREVEDERKPWTVTMSMEVKNTTSNLAKLRVVDMFGDPVQTKIEIKGDQIIVTPLQNYVASIPYTLVIDEGLENVSGERMRKGAYLKFSFSN